jgi:hypothetical protein
MTTATLPTLAEDVARRVALKERADHIAQEIALIDDRLRTHDFGNHDAGEYQLQVQHNRRLDAAAIEARFPVAQYPHLYKPAVNTAALKENFAPVELEKFYVEGAPKIMVR